MSIQGNPYIIHDSSLVLSLNAANPKSFLSGNTTIYDLSSKISSATGTLTNGPVYSSSGNGSITMDGTNDYILITTNLASPFGSGTAESIFTWFYPTAAGQIVSEIGQATINTGWHDSNIEVSSGGVFSFSIWHNSLTNKVVSSAYTLSKWYYLGFSYDGTTLTGYVNGVRVGTTTFTRAAPYNNGYGLYYGICANDGTNMGTNAYAAGNFASFDLYSRALTSDEVIQNYDAARSRFGL